MPDNASSSADTFEQILDLIAQLRERLEVDPTLTDKQRAQLQALLDYYLTISKDLQSQFFSIMPPESKIDGFDSSIMPPEGPKP